MAPWARLRRTWCVRRAVPPRPVAGPPARRARTGSRWRRLTWARGTENGHEVWTCDVCSRAHLRSIEGKLDPAWW